MGRSGLSIVSRPCSICSTASSRLWRSVGPWTYLQCNSCSAVLLDPLPTESQLQGLYDSNYFAGAGRGGYMDYLAEEAQHRSNARSRIQLAQRFGAAKAGATWLDVGCAAGYTLDEARKDGLATFGVELSEWAIDIARQRLGLQVFPTMAQARERLIGQVDILSFFQVFEHLRDPVAALADARACLRPEGLLLIETWDRGSTVARLVGRHWQQITPPSVLWLFDRKSLVYMLEAAGFRVLSFERMSKKVSVGWSLWQLSDKLPAFLARAARRLAQSSLGKLTFSYGLGDLVSVVAVAPATPAKDQAQAGESRAAFADNR